MPQDDLELSVQSLAGLLTTHTFGRRHVHLETCGSTNDVLSNLARAAGAAAAEAAAPEGTIVTADAQTGGRGRMGRVWHSPAGENLYVSILLRPAMATAGIPPLTLLAGGALAETVSRCEVGGEVEVEVRLKWPNDLLVRPRGATTEHRFRKVAGILTEAATEGDRLSHVVVGIGLNLNTAEFPADLADKATSLRLATGKLTPRARLLAGLLADFERAYLDFQARGTPAALALWERHAHLGQLCRGRGTQGEVTGHTAGVGPDGELLIRDATGHLHRIFSGEVVPLPGHSP
jgi:BirA family biotin operon repressor/biotin-[acetyl-CoA-carboxylase] ligase